MKKRLNAIADSWHVSVAFLIGACLVAIGAVALLSGIALFVLIAEGKV